MKLGCPMYSKQTSKIWSLKSLFMLKCESTTSPHDDDDDDELFLWYG